MNRKVGKPKKFKNGFRCCHNEDTFLSLHHGGGGFQVQLKIFFAQLYNKISRDCTLSLGYRSGATTQATIIY